MKSGLAVIGVCLAISGVLAYVVKQQFQTELVGSQDLMLGLIYFMETHDGRMPATEEEFRAQPFVVELPDGAVRIEAPADTRYQPETHGYVISDLDPFKIRWGADLSDLTVDEYGRVAEPDGEQIELFRWPGSPPSGKGYSVVLLGTSREIQSRNRQQAASQPTTQAVDATP